MIRTSIHMEIRGGADQMRRDWPQIRRDALAELGQWWHENYMPLKFEPFAAGMYGYAPRTYGYRQRKQRVQGHTQPLVWSGSLKSDVLGWAEVRTAGDHADVIMRSQVLNMVSRRVNEGGYPDMNAELSAVAPSEPERFARWLDDVATRKLQELDGVTTM